jgi:hypothetical protein
MKLGWAFFVLAVIVLGGYSLDRGLYIGSQIEEDTTAEDAKARDRIQQQAQEALERDRAAHANDPSWRPNVDDVFPDLPRRSYKKFCRYLFPSGAHWTSGGRFYEGNVEPPCRLFEQR